MELSRSRESACGRENKINPITLSIEIGRLKGLKLYDGNVNLLQSSLNTNSSLIFISKMPMISSIILKEKS